MQPVPLQRNVTAERLFGCLVTALQEHAVDVALFAQTGYSFEGWLLWSWLATASRQAGWQVRPEPTYGAHGLNGPSSSSRGDLIAIGEDGSRTWAELALVHDWTSVKWYAEEGKLAMDRRRLTINAGKGIELLQVVVVASNKAVAKNEAWMEPLRRSGCWADEPSFSATVPLLPDGQALVVGWLIAKAALG